MSRPLKSFPFVTKMQQISFEFKIPFKLNQVVFEYFSIAALLNSLYYTARRDITYRSADQILSDTFATNSYPFQLHCELIDGNYSPNGTLHHDHHYHHAYELTVCVVPGRHIERAARTWTLPSVRLSGHPSFAIWIRSNSHIDFAQLPHSVVC